MGQYWVKHGSNVDRVGCLGHVDGSVGHVGPMGHMGHSASEFV